MEVNIKNYCEEHGMDIYVREFVNGTWKSVPLAMLPEKTQEKYVTEWEQDQFLPHIVK